MVLLDGDDDDDDGDGDDDDGDGDDDDSPPSDSLRQHSTVHDYGCGAMFHSMRRGTKNINLGVWAMGGEGRAGGAV